MRLGVMESEEAGKDLVLKNIPLHLHVRECRADGEPDGAGGGVHGDGLLTVFQVAVMEHWSS